MNEEQLMFVAAKSRNADLKVDTSNISFTGDRGFFDDETELEELKSELTRQLIETPYLKTAIFGKGKFYQNSTRILPEFYQNSTFKISRNAWSIPIFVYNNLGFEI